MTASVDSRSFPSSKERKATIDRGIERNRWSKKRRKGKEGKRRSASIDRSFGFRKEGVASNHHFDRPPPKTRKPLPSSLSLSPLFFSPTSFISLLDDPRSFPPLEERKTKRKEIESPVVLRCDTDAPRSTEDSAQGLFRLETERERRPEPAYRRLKRGDASEREIGTVGRQGTSVRNENGSLHLLEEQRRPRLLHGIASIIPVGAYLPGL